MKDIAEESAVRKDGYIDRPVIVHDPTGTWKYNDNARTCLRQTFTHQTISWYCEEGDGEIFLQEIHNQDGDDARGLCLIPARYRRHGPEDFARRMFGIYEIYGAVTWPTRMTFLLADFRLRRDAAAFAPNIFAAFKPLVRKTVPDEVNLITIAQHVQDAFAYSDSPTLKPEEMEWVDANYSEIHLFLNPREISSWTVRGLKETNVHD